MLAAWLLVERFLRILASELYGRCSNLFWDLVSKRFKDDVKEVAKGYDCGLQIKNYNDVKIGDVLECYQQIAIKKSL